MKQPGRTLAGRLPGELIRNRGLIARLAVNDFRTRYAGSYFGIIWAFIQPVVTVFVYWMVFGLGFKTASGGDVPFVVYLTCGIVPWFYFQEILVSGTGAFIEYSYLVKKVVFEFGVLPFVKIVSAFFVHAFFVAVAIVIAAIYGIYPSVYLIQILYYFFAVTVFAAGICYATSSAVIFFRDLSQIVNIILQIGIWSVPIMFRLEAFETKSWVWIFRINPMFYIVNGYRDAIYNHVWFFERWRDGLYFWAWAIVLIIIGTGTFDRLKDHFADVL